jgi:hypothetical protein
MKRSLPAVALLLIAIALPAQAQTRRQIVAGPVKAAGDGISGSFRVQESRRAGIVSIGTGGACLVAERSDRACETDGDCVDLRTHYHPHGAAYCLSQPGLHKHATCWVRPGKDVDFCLKSPVAALPLDTRLELPHVDPRTMADGHDVRWRVHACLNGYDAATKADNHACGDSAATNRMTSDGPPRRIP